MLALTVAAFFAEWFIWTVPLLIGLDHTLIPHVADSSFSRDHSTLWWAIAFGLVLQRGSRVVGVALALLGVPIAWARIHLGVHFPFDMLGAGALALFSAWLTARGCTGIWGRSTDVPPASIADFLAG